MTNKPSFKMFPLYFFFCWLPATLLSALITFNTDLKIPYLIVTPVRWLAAVVFLVGWSVLIYQITLEYPWQSFGVVLVYAGIHIVVVSIFYSITSMGSSLPISFNALSFLVGIFSFTPLAPLLDALLKFDFPHEVVVIGIIVVFFISFWVAGALRGRVIRKRRGF